MYEKVNPSHPDKIADRIAGALVDLAYKQQTNPKIAVEVLIGHGKCHIIAESSVCLNKDDVKNCHPIANTDGEYRGTCYEIHEYEGRDIEVNYYIWFKIVK